MIRYGIPAVLLAVALAGCGDRYGDQLTAIEAGELCETGEEMDGGNLSLTIRDDVPDDHPESVVSLQCVLLALDTPDDVRATMADTAADPGPHDTDWGHVGAVWQSTSSVLVVVIGPRE